MTAERTGRRKAAGASAGARGAGAAAQMRTAALGCVASLLLAVAFVAAGFAAVAVPDVATVALASEFSGASNPSTPFSKDELVQMAIAGKHYTFDSNDPNELYEAELAINRSAQAAGRAAHGAPDLDGVADAADMKAAGERANEAYVLPADAVSHLDDVYRVVAIAKPVIAVLAALAVATAALLARSAGKRALGRALTAAGGVVLAAFACALLWAFADFYGFFAAFHSLFFKAGTWTFSAKSLLITMYPTDFWMGMGGVWLAVTCVLSALSLVVGSKLRRSR